MKRSRIFNFNDLANSPEFKEFYSAFWELTHIPLALVDPTTPENNKLFCPEESFNPICKLLRASPVGMKRCYDFDYTKVEESLIKHQGICYKCYAGLMDFTVPIYVGKRLIATVNCVQILSGPPTNEGFKKLWDSVCDLPVDKQTLRETYFASTYMTPMQIKAVLRILTFFCDYFCEVGVRLRILEKNNKYPEIEKAKEYLRKHYHEPISLSNVSGYVAFSESYFSTLFKNVQGISFTQYLQEIRLDEVKRLLADTNTAISKIAFNCGFSNLSYFNIFFRRMMKCSPSQYRAKNSKAK